MRPLIREAIQKEVLEKQKRIVKLYFKNKLNQEISDSIFIPGRYEVDISFIIHKMVIVPHIPDLEINLKCEFKGGKCIIDDIYFGEPYENTLTPVVTDDYEDICDAIAIYVENHLIEYFGIGAKVNVDLL
jgi:hypothetical protein